MLNIFLLFWNKQSKKEKLLFIIIGVALIFITYQGISISIYKYKYFKIAEQQRDIYQDSINVLNIKVENLITKATTQTKQTQATSKKIDAKIKNDEKIIDDIDVSDSELDSFLAKYKGS